MEGLTSGDGFPVRPRTEQGRLGRSNRPSEDGRPTRRKTVRTVTATRRQDRVTAVTSCKNGSRGQPRSAQRSRQLVSPPGTRRGAHARRRLRDLRGDRADPPRADRRDRVAAAPGSPLPAATRVRAARAGPAGVGRRPAFQRRLPRPAHRASATRRRGSTDAADRARVLAGARSQQAAVGDLAGGGRHRRPLRAALEDPSRARRRDLRRRHHDRPVRHVRRPDAGRAARSRVGPAAAAEQRAAARRCAPGARDRPRRDGPWDPRGAAGPARNGGPGGGGSGRSRRARAGRIAAGAVEHVQRADRSAPPIHVGARRPRRIQGGQERARRDPQRRRADGRRGRARTLHAPARRGHRRSRAPGDGPGVDPRGRRARRAWQPGCGDVGAAARRGDRPGASACTRSASRCARSRSPARPLGPRCSRR